MRLMTIFFMASVLMMAAGKLNAESGNASTQNTWVQQTPKINASSMIFLQAVKLGEHKIVADIGWKPKAEKYHW